MTAQHQKLYWDSDPVKGDPLGRVRYRIVARGKTITQSYYSSSDLDAEGEIRRLVACWNACDGLSASFLEDVAKLRAEPLRDLVKETEAERDELLAALQAIVQSWDNNTFDRERYVTSELGDYWTPVKAMVNSETIAAARAAIQKATQGGAHKEGD